MEWVQFTIFFLGVFGLFIWNKTESRADIRRMDNEIDAIWQLTYAIRAEMKDLHTRLCVIEEKNKNR